MILLDTDHLSVLLDPRQESCFTDENSQKVLAAGPFVA